MAAQALAIARVFMQLRAIFILLSFLCASIGNALDELPLTEPRVKSDQHPRVYLDMQRVERIRAAVAGSSKGDRRLAEAWRDTQAPASLLADAYLQGERPVTIVTGSPYKLAMAAKLLGFGYLITEENEYLRAARILAQQLTRVPEPQIGGDFIQAGRIEAMGILYDWFFDVFTEHEKVQLLEAIQRTLPLLAEYICGEDNGLTTHWTCSSMPPFPSAVGGHAFENGRAISAGVLAIIDEAPQLGPLLEVLYYNFKELYNPLREWVAVDGAFHMGWGYGSTYLSLHPVLLWNTATENADVSAPWQGRLIDFFIYGLRGDMLFPLSGDGKGKRLHYQNIMAFALTAYQDFNNPYAADFYRRWLLPVQGSERTEELLFWRAEAIGKPIEELPLSRHFRNAGFVLARDTWDYAEATLLSFKSTAFWSHNHHHLDQNSFALFYKVPLLIDSGHYGRYGSTHWSNYYTRSIAHNLVTIWSPSETFVGQTIRGVPCCSNDGGQKIMRERQPTLEEIMPGGSNSLDGIVAYSATDAFTYARGNASRAYSADKLDQQRGFLRDIMFLQPGDVSDRPIVVVFDQIRLAAGECCLEKRFLLHTLNEPVEPEGTAKGAGIHEMSGRVVLVQGGDVTLTSQTVLPAASSIRKIGGKDEKGDFRFLVPPLGASSYSNLKNFPPSRAPVRDAQGSGWRIEVMSTSASSQERFLHVFSIADEGRVSMPPVKGYSEGGVSGVVIQNRIGVFFLGDESGEEPPDIQGLPLTQTIYVAGLRPEENFAVRLLPESGGETSTVSISPSAEGAFQSDSGGVLAVSATQLKSGL